MTDYTGRISIDTMGYQYVTIRAIYEKTKRIGTGFSEDAIEEGGAQPGLRFYDEADRNRDKATLLFVLNPVSMVDVNFSVGYGKDVYGGPGHDFGLLDAKTNSYNIGVNAYPKDTISFGMNYGRDTFNSLQKSRNANPQQDLTAVPPVLASDYGSWFDPNRDWTLTNDETVNNFNLYLDLIKAMPKTDIRFAYDYSDSDNAFVHGGPRIQELSTNKALSGPSAIVYPGFAIPAPCTAPNTTCFEALPDVTNKWQRFTFDLKYFFTAKAGLGLGWWYEKFDVKDFATIDSNGSVGYTAATGTPRIDYLGGLILGYGNRPYTGNTGFIRMIYLF
jgi:Putative outer membrane beta-barrel porin, MtrB/PioB